MPRLQVDISKPEKDNEPFVRYERPRLARVVKDDPVKWTGYISVKNELLLPEADRPTGFKQKAKAALSSDYFPTYSFDWECLAPRHLYFGQPAAFEIHIRPRENECTAVVIPDVHLSSLTAEVKAHTQVRAEKQLFTSPESSSDTTVSQADGYKPSLSLRHLLTLVPFCLGDNVKGICVRPGAILQGQRLDEDS